MRHLCLLLLLSFSLTGCIRQTMTEVPAMSGTVVDSNTGQPLAGVKLEGDGQTDRDGRFSLDAVAHGFWTIPMPGAGVPVSRRVTFRKAGYRDTTCVCTNFSLFAGENSTAVPLLKNVESDPPTQPPIFLKLTDTVACQAFIGSLVLYQGRLYLIGEIDRPAPPEAEEDDPYWTQFTLWTFQGETIMDVTGDELQLTARPVEK